MKKENVIRRVLPSEVHFAGRMISEIYFDLNHINFGWDPKTRDYRTKQRSAFREEDVVYFFGLIPENDYKEVFTNQSGVEQRFVSVFLHEDEFLRIVVDFMETDQTMIVTLYEVK